MAQPCGPLIDQVGQRVFDPHFTGTSRAQVRDLLSRASQVVNGAFDSTLVLKAVPTSPTLQVYNFERIAADVLRIKAVRDGTRDLSLSEFSRLKQIDNHWFGRRGRRFETFAVLGRRLLVIHPLLPWAGSVNVLYTQQLPALAVDSDPVNLPDDQLPALTRLTEALVLLKQRDLDKLAALITELPAALGLSAPAAAPGEAA